MDRSVVLPAPFGPSTPKIAPRGTAKETRRRAGCNRRRGQPLRKVLLRPRTSTAGSVGVTRFIVSYGP